MQSLKINRKSVITINAFLEQYEDSINSDIQHLFKLDFQLKKRRDSKKIRTTLQIAEPEDAEVIASLFRDVYHGTYPYKKMEDEEEVRRMIKDENHAWVIYKANLKMTVGCFGADLDFKNKKGILYGFLIKKSYQNNVDSLKAFVASLIYFWTYYKDKILVWSGEVRTNDATAQFATSLCGLKPIAFFPNKDIFFNRIESDFMITSYNEEVFTNYRCEANPRLIRQVLNCYTYSNQRYNLGVPHIENPTINLNKSKLIELEKKIDVVFENKDFGYENIIISIKNSDSYFKFSYNPYSKHFEKTKYKVNQPEELNIFLKKVKDLIKKMDVNYFQCFVSAYNPVHQKIFYQEGFRPRGYVPCWNYKKNLNVFEDKIVFNYFTGNAVKNIKLIPESEKMLQSLNFYKEELFP